MSETEKQSFVRRHAVAIGAAVPSLVLAALWYYTQLLQWKRHGDDFMLTVGNIIVTGLMWIVLLCWIIYFEKNRRKCVAAKTMPTATESGPSKLTIHLAVYGTGPDTDIDVTDKVRGIIHDALVVPVANDLVPRDPHFGVVKRLMVEYSYGNFSRVRLTRPENTRLVLPEDTWVRDELARYENKNKESENVANYAAALNRELASVNEKLKDSEQKRLMPRPYLGIDESDEAMFRRTPFTFTNSGGDVAHKVQIQPLRIHYHDVTFELVDTIAINNTKTVLPTISGKDVMDKHDIMGIMREEWNASGTASGGIPREHSVNLTISYEDFSEKKFEATAELVYFPLNESLMRVKNAFPPNAKNRLKIIEVRNIKFRPI